MSGSESTFWEALGKNLIAEPMYPGEKGFYHLI